MEWVSLKDVTSDRGCLSTLQRDGVQSFFIRSSWYKRKLDLEMIASRTGIHLGFIQFWNTVNAVYIFDDDDEKKLLLKRQTIFARLHISAAIVKRERGSKAIKKSGLLFSFRVWLIPPPLSAQLHEYKRSSNLYSCDDDNTVRRKQGGDGHSGPFYPRCTRTKRGKFAVRNLRRWERRAQGAA